MLPLLLTNVNSIFVFSTLAKAHGGEKFPNPLNVGGVLFHLVTPSKYMIIEYVLRFKMLHIVVYSIYIYSLLFDGNHSLLLDLAGSLLPVQ